MFQATLDEVLVQLHDRLAQADFAGAIATIESLRAVDQAELFSGLDNEQQAALLPQLSSADSADILEKLDDREAAAVAAGLPTADLTRIVAEMEPDEAADLLAELETWQAGAVLAALEDPDEVRPLLLHAQDSAGGLMTSSYLALRRRMTVADAFTAVRTLEPEAEEIYTLFVVDRHGNLCGEVSFRGLVMADPGTLVMDIMNPEVISVPTGTDQEECARIMARYDLMALPVTGPEGLLLGVITIDDVVDVIVDEATEDLQRFGASEPLEEPYLETTTWTVYRKRIGWLLLLFLTETLTGSVLRHFEAELAAVVSLAFFIPLLIGTGGNAGSQATSTIIRAMALGDLDRRTWLRPLWHELRVGLLLGATIAVVAYGRAILWQASPGVAWTVAIALFAIVVWANILGSVLPLVARRLKVDPAVVSGPAMSTLVDATGLFIYFTIAGILLAT